MPVYHGRNSTLQQQFETVFRTAPGAPSTQLLKFSKVTVGREAELAEDPTINANALMEKRQEQDASAPISAEGILCLNDIGFWLRMLLGAPQTTGTGPYTHVFTLNLNARPSSLFEFAMSDGVATRYHRHLGVMLNSFGWNLLNVEQQFQAEFIGAYELRPYPTTPFDATPAARLAKLWACKKLAKIWDGAASIGDIADATIQFNNDLEGQSLGDGLEGFGQILLGQPTVGGQMDVLFTPGTLVDAALARSSKHIVMVSQDPTGAAKLTVDIPNAEFDVPRVVVDSSKGQVARGLAWRAHHVDGADPITVTLENGIATY